MADKLDKIRDKIKSMPEVILEGIRDSFIEFGSVVEDMNIEQLQEGKRSDGSTMPDYSPVSVEVYGKPEGPIRLKDTGEFYRGISAVAGTDEATLMGKDSKTKELEFEYGNEIIGLTEDNKEEFKRDYMAPSIQDKIKEKIND